MTFLILLVGIFIVGTCMAFFIFPGLVDDLIEWLGRQRNLYLVAAIRLGVGAILLLGAGGTRFPGAIWWLGILFIAAAALLLLLSPERVVGISERFLRSSVGMIRLWVFLPLALGIFILASVL
jgi:hypothetical protein